MATRRFIKLADGTCYRVPDTYTAPISPCFSLQDAINNNFILDAGCLGFNRANNPNCIVFTPTPVPILPTPVPVAPVPLPVAPIPVPMTTCTPPAFILTQATFNSQYFRIIVSGGPGHRVKYSAGNNYIGDNDCGSYTPIGSGGTAQLLVPIPAAGSSQAYAVRVYNGADCNCYSTQSITITNQIGTANIDFRWADLNTADFQFRIVGLTTGGQLQSGGGTAFLGGGSGGSALAALSQQRCLGASGGGIYRFMVSCVKLRNAGYSGEISFDVYAKVTDGPSANTIYPTVSSTIGGDMSDGIDCLGFGYTGVAANSNTNQNPTTVTTTESKIGQYWVNLNTNASGWR